MMARPRPPVEVRRVGNRQVFLPEFVREELPDSTPERPRTRRRATEESLTAATAAAAAFRSELDAAGREPPTEEELLARLERVLRNIPEGDVQEVVILRKKAPPWWGVTTRRLRNG